MKTLGTMGAAVTSATFRQADYPCVISRPARVAERGRGESNSPPSSGVRKSKSRAARSRGIAGGILFLSLLLLSFDLYAQPNPPASAPIAEDESSVERIRPDEPIDLPLEMLLRLSDTGTSIFSKKPLRRPEPLAPAVLDTLNPQGKEGEMTIPLRGYPEPDQPPTKNRPIYAEGSIGLHTTALLRAGISGSTWPFDYNASVEYGSSSGWVENAESSLFSARLGGGYVIGLGYGIFSGGYMGGEAEYNSRTYRLYALETLPERSRVDWKVQGTGTASVAGIDLKGEGRLRRFSMDQRIPVLDETGPAPLPSPDTQAVAETSVEGRLSAGMSALGLGWEGSLDLRLTNTDLGSVNYGRFDLLALFETPVFSVRGGGAVSLGEGTDGESRSRLSPQAELRIFPFDGLVVAGKIAGGIRQTTARSLFDVNPYATMDGLLAPEDEKLGYELSLHLEPAQSWGVRVAGARRDYASYLFFGPPETGEFVPAYAEAKVDIVSGDFYVRLDSRNEFSGVVRFTEGTLVDGSPIPYMPKWDAELFYSRRLFNLPIEIGASVRYIGERRGGTEELDPAFLLGFEWSYNVAKLFDVVLEARNLLAQEYQIWEGYEERGLYLSLGARTRF